MSHLKTATSVLTAALLVTGIGLAVAQTEDQQPPAEPMAATATAGLSEQTPADPNALPPADTTAQQQMPLASDQPQAAPPADSSTPLPGATPAQPATDSSYAAPASTTRAEPAPRADRN